MKTLKRMGWRFVFFAALIIMLIFSMTLVACGKRYDGPIEPQENAVASGKMLTLKSGAPADPVGKEGDVCLVADSGTIYRKTESGWIEADYESYDVRGERFTITYNDGFVGTYDMAVSSENCNHKLGETYTVYEPKCVIPGIGVQYCEECYEAFPVIIPALSDHHSYDMDNTCSICGDELQYTEGLNIRYDKSKNYAIVQDNRSLSGNVVIPYAYEGHIVKEISSYAFSGSSITGISMPDSIEIIGSYAFSDCKSLKCNLVLPTSLRETGSDAFKNCSGLTGELVFGENMEIIGNYTFYKCSGLTGIKFTGNKLKTIDYYAFESCTGLQGKLNIPSSVTKISYCAFRGCAGLTGLVLPEGLEVLDEASFDGCSGIKGIVRIPDAVTELFSVFRGCSGLEGVEFGKESKLELIDYETFCDCSNLSGELVIPKNVKLIGVRAFENCSKLTKLTFAEGSSLQYICCLAYGSGEIEPSWAGSAFAGCSGLIGVIEFPDSLEVLGSDSFSGCSGITGIKFGSESKLYDIESRVFYGCNELSGELVLPDSLKTIKDGAFEEAYDYRGDDKITSVKFGNSLEEIPSNLFGNRPHLTGTIIIPASVKKIGSYAFYNTGIDALEICDEDNDKSQLESIDNEAFYGCANLGGKIVFPDSLKSIGTRAFSFDERSGGSNKISAIEFGTNSQLETIGDYAFFTSINIKGDLILPDSVTKIGTYAFAKTGFDGRLELSDSLIEIGDGAFYACSEFTGELTIPASVESIGIVPIRADEPKRYWVGAAGAFRECIGFSALNLPQEGSLKVIGGSAFLGCSGFRGELVLPDSVTDICRGAFLGCSGFTGTVKIPKNIRIDDSEEGSIITTGFGAGKHDSSNVTYSSIHYESTSGNYPIFKWEGIFRECSGIEKVDFSESSVTKIGWTDFFGCTSLKEIVLSKNVTQIGEFAFDSCTSLVKVTFVEDTLETIGDYAFYDCKALELLDLPEGLDTIAEGAFKGCKALKGTEEGKLILPNSLTSIGEDAFGLDSEVWVSLDDEQDGGKIISVYFGDSLDVVNGRAFYGRMAITELTFGQGVKEIAAYAFSYYNIERINFVQGSKMTKIGSRAFEQNANLTGISFPDSLQTIGSYAFYRTGLQNIEFGQGLETIEDYVFYACTKLTGDIVFPDSLKSIGNSAFYHDHNITSINFTKDSRLESIGSSAFAYLELITKVLIPKGVTSIGSGAFRNCSALWEVWNYSTSLQLSPESNVWSDVKKVHTIDEPSSFVTVGEYDYFDSGDDGYCFLLAYHGSAEELTLPESVPSGKKYIIYTSAFENCQTLKNVILGNGVIEIGENAFKNCKNLKSLTFSNSLQMIGNNAFANTEIESIRFLGSVTEWNVIRYASTDKNPYWCSYIELLTVTCNDGEGEIVVWS